MNTISQIKDLLAAMNVNGPADDEADAPVPLSPQQRRHDEEKLGQLADLMRTTLGITYKDNTAYLEIAKQMARFSIKSPESSGGNGGGGGTPTTTATNVVSTTTTTAASMMSKDDGGIHNRSSPPSYHHQQPQQRGRSPARTIAGDDGTGGETTTTTATGSSKPRSSSTQSAAAARNKTFTHHSAYSPSRRQNDQTPPPPKLPLRQEYPNTTTFFSSSTTPSSAGGTSATPRKNSPPRYPTTNTTMNVHHKYFKGENGFKSASPEEKKESEPKNNLIKRRFQQRDVSTGGSPPRSVSPTRYGSTTMQAPPSTPKDHDRSNCRSTSPFAARPGLQEGGDSDSVSLCGRSPGRSYSSMTTQIPTSIPNIPNVSSGMSSHQHHHPSGVPHHSRSRSQGVDSDIESICKPNKPRPHSQSPMRKPASTDTDEGDLPLEQPSRAFSISPRGNNNAYSFINMKDSVSSTYIQLPDLLSNISIPDIGAGQGGQDATDVNNGGSGLFTPPTRTSSSSNAAAAGSDRSYGDDPMSAYPIGPSSGLKPRSAFPVEELFGQNARGNGGIGVGGPIPTPPAKFAPLERSPSPMDIDDDDASSLSPPAPPAFSLGQANKPLQRRPQSFRSKATTATTTASSSPSAAKLPPPTTTTPNSTNNVNNNNVSSDSSLAFINAKREEARNYFGLKNFRSSIQSYTQALKIFSAATAELPRDTYAVLLSNRAACLLMVGAYDAAVADCTMALQHVTMPLPNQPFSNDGGYMLKTKLYTRLGRSYMKLGLHAESIRAFEDACQTAEVASGFSKENHLKEDYRQNLEFLSQLKTEAALGQSDAKRLKDACANLTLSMQHILYGQADRTKYADALGHVNIALSMATGSVKLIESKLSILSYMKRWREVGGFCERLAACLVVQDGIFVEDLESLNPFPGVPPARYLKADYFKNTRDEDMSTRDLKLTSKAAAEAVVRMPVEITPTYLRALRLEERYPAAESAIQSLEELSKRTGASTGWLTRERAKVALTKSRREEADEMFRNKEFEQATKKYNECLLIDKDGNSHFEVDGLNAGGRLHAVLHCNLAACYMARQLHHDAVEECTNALRIHGRYMKAILRRARCYKHLNQMIEAISEYRRWLNLVEDRSEYTYNAACIFDGPQDVKPEEIVQVKEDMENVQKAKRRAEAKAKEEADRRRAQQRTQFQENFSASWRSTSGASAQQRRNNFYEQQDDHSSSNNHWDSFSTGRGGARSNSNPRPRLNSNNNQDSGSFRSNSQGRASPRSAIDHYATLDIPRSASEDDIKKAFRKMALKYHPDKNKDSNAGDNFRKVKLAHEVLSDPVKRREYDTGYRRPY